jgi:hypothetical protein
MSDEKNNFDVPIGDDVAAIRVGAFTDSDGDHVVLVNIGGLVFGTCAPTLEEGMELARRTMQTLIRFQRSTSLRIDDHVGTLQTPPPKDGGN